MGHRAPRLGRETLNLCWLCWFTKAVGRVIETTVWVFHEPPNTKLSQIRQRNASPITWQCKRRNRLPIWQVIPVKQNAHHFNALFYSSGNFSLYQMYLWQRLLQSWWRYPKFRDVRRLWSWVIVIHVIPLGREKSHGFIGDLFKSCIFGRDGVHLDAISIILTDQKLFPDLLAASKQLIEISLRL